MITRCGTITIKLEGVVEGIHHHLLLFVHISPNKGLAAMAQAEMGALLNAH